MFEERTISYNMRDGSVLTQPISFKRYFSYYGVHIWNILPNDLKICRSINSF